MEAAPLVLLTTMLGMGLTFLPTLRMIQFWGAQRWPRTVMLVIIIGNVIGLVISATLFITQHAPLPLLFLILMNLVWLAVPYLEEHLYEQWLWRQEHAELQRLEMQARERPDIGCVHTALAECYLKRGRLGEARAAIEQALALTPVGFDRAEHLLLQRITAAEESATRRPV